MHEYEVDRQGAHSLRMVPPASAHNNAQLRPHPGDSWDEITSQNKPFIAKKQKLELEQHKQYSCNIFKNHIPNHSV